MQALFEKITDCIDDCWRFRWQALGLAWLVSVVGWTVLASVPTSYEARGQVIVPMETIEWLDPEHRLPSAAGVVRSTLIEPERLESAASEAGLLLDSRDAAGILADLAESVLVTDVLRWSELYTVSFTDTNGDAARRLVAGLLNRVAADTTTDGVRLVDGATVEVAAVSPDRPFWVAIAFALGLASGVAYALLKARRMPAVFDRPATMEIAGHRIIGAIRQAQMPAALAARRSQRLLLTVGIAGLVAAMLVVSWLQQVWLASV